MKETKLRHSKTKHKTGLLARMQKKATGGKWSLSHCIVHQEVLYGKVQNMDHVMHMVTKTVHLIRDRGLNHRQFQAFLEELNVECYDFPYHTEVRWLSWCLVPWREIYGEKSDFFLWEKQMQQGNLFHFPTCQAISNSLTNVTIPSTGFTAKLNLLCKEFERHFLPYYRSHYHRPTCMLHKSPQCLDAHTCANSYSLMKLNKSPQRSRLNDSHLHSILKIASAQDITPDIDKLVS
ncbi:GTD2A protein, partial [Amia calva]|nr:GTD2A protein [Amia calva]